MWYEGVIVSVTRCEYLGVADCVHGSWGSCDSQQAHPLQAWLTCPPIHEEGTESRPLQLGLCAGCVREVTHAISTVRINLNLLKELSLEHRAVAISLSPCLQTQPTKARVRMTRAQNKNPCSSVYLPQVQKTTVSIAQESRDGGRRLSLNLYPFILLQVKYRCLLCTYIGQTQ